MSDLTPSQFARIQEAYLRAGGLPARDRSQIVRELLGDDPALIAEFERLPEFEDIPTTFLAPPKVNHPISESRSEMDRIGPVIDRFRLLSLLGEGGFGIVYEAEQAEPIRRRVALKIIKPGMDSRAVLNRFQAERQALALMDHPSIARVFDGGVTGPDSGHPGLPYFVMELVRGDSITTFCDRERLTIERRIELMIQVCEAIQHAHLKGVIHRDIKPSNVLVSYQDGRPVPKIIDFGVAKAVGHGLTEHTLFTHRGQLIGTPAYMSPEQAEMSGVDIDSRTDVYSLGVLLYEVLTSRPPFDPETLRSAGYAEMVRIIREVEPPRPSTRLSTLNRAASGDDSAIAIAKARRAELNALTRRLRTDLDWVVMKCLQKERDRRYTTAREVAEELRRILRFEPVLAGPPRLSYRLKKYLRRHRVSVIWAATLVTLVVVALTFIGSLAQQNARLRQAQQERARIADEFSLMAPEDRITADGRVSLFARDSVQGRTTSVLSIQPASWVQEFLRARPEEWAFDETLHGDRVAAQAAQLVNQPVPKEVADAVELTKLLLLHGQQLLALRQPGPGRTDLARDVYQRAALICDRLDRIGADPEQSLLAAMTYEGLGDALRQSDSAGSLTAYRQAAAALDLLKRSETGLDAELERWSSRLRRDVAVALARVCDMQTAEAMIREVVDERSQLRYAAQASTYETAVASRDLSVSLTTLAEILRSDGQTADAVAYARMALRLREQILSNVTNLTDASAVEHKATFERDVPVCRIILAECLSAQGEQVEASELLHIANQELAAQVAKHTDDSRLPRTLIECLFSQAEVALRSGDASQAAGFVEAAAVAISQLKISPQRAIDYDSRVQLLLGSADVLAGNPAKAVPALELSIDLINQLRTGDPSRVEFDRRLGRALVQLAQAHLMNQPLDSASVAEARSLALQANGLYESLERQGRACGVSDEERQAPSVMLQRARALGAP